jgi:hypothetical protein
MLASFQLQAINVGCSKASTADFILSYKTSLENERLQQPKRHPTDGDREHDLE